MMKSKQVKPKACVNSNWPKECPMVKDDASVCAKDCFFICTICDKGFNKNYAYSLSFLCDEHKKFVIGEFEKREGIKVTISTDMMPICLNCGEPLEHEEVVDEVVCINPECVKYLESQNVSKTTEEIENE